MEDKAVMFFIILIVGTELSADLHIFSNIILCYVYQPFGYHDGNGICYFAESVYGYLCGVKPFSQKFVTKGKTCYHFSS